MHLLSRVALGLLGLSFGSSLACQMENPAYDLGDAGLGSAGETRGTGDGDLSSSGESKTTTGDGDPSTGDGDPGTGDGDPTTGDGDPTTGDGDGDPTTGDGDGDGDPTTGDGDGDGGSDCGNGIIEPGEDCDDGNANDLDECTNNCTLSGVDPNECMAVAEPETCTECLNGNCCNPDGLFCAGNMACMCLLACLTNEGEMFCMQECMTDLNVLAKAAATLPCAQAHCPAQCIEG